MPWRAMFQDGAVRPDGSVSVSVRYEQWNTSVNPPVKLADFQEPINFGPNDPVTQQAVRQIAMARVSILNGREGVVNAIGNLKEQDIATWPAV